MTAPAFGVGVCKNNQISAECLPTGTVSSEALHSTHTYSIKGKTYAGNTARGNIASWL